MTDEDIECEPITKDEFTATMRELMTAKYELKSENRTPTKAELNRKFLLERCG